MCKDSCIPLIPLKRDSYPPNSKMKIDEVKFQYYLTIDRNFFISLIINNKKNQWLSSKLGMRDLFPYHLYEPLNKFC